MPVPKTTCQRAMSREDRRHHQHAAQGRRRGRYGPAGRACADRDSAGKTGTTDNRYAAWFVGYTPNMAGAVWVGDPHAQAADGRASPSAASPRQGLRRRRARPDLAGRRVAAPWTAGRPRASTSSHPPPRATGQAQGAAARAASRRRRPAGGSDGGTSAPARHHRRHGATAARRRRADERRRRQRRPHRRRREPRRPAERPGRRGNRVASAVAATGGRWEPPGRLRDLRRSDGPQAARSALRARRARPATAPLPAPPPVPGQPSDAPTRSARGPSAPASSFLTAAATRPPSARPATFGLTIFMTAPIARGPSAPAPAASATAAATICSSSSSDSCWGR